MLNTGSDQFQAIAPSRITAIRPIAHSPAVVRSRASGSPRDAHPPPKAAGGEIGPVGRVNGL